MRHENFFNRILNKFDLQITNQINNIIKQSQQFVHIFDIFLSSFSMNLRNWGPSGPPGECRPSLIEEGEKLSPKFEFSKNKEVGKL